MSKKICKIFISVLSSIIMKNERVNHFIFKGFRRMKLDFATYRCRELFGKEWITDQN